MLLRPLIVQSICLALLSVNAWALDLSADLALGSGAKTIQYIDINSYLTINPAGPVDYGNVNTGSTSDQIFTITGVGAEEISLSVSGTGYSLLSTTCGNNPFDLLTGTCTATVRFTPASAGTLTGSLIVAWTNQTSVVAGLTGVGVQTDPYTTYFASDWAGTGVQDTSNPSGGVYSGWTSVSDTATLLANTSNALVATYGGVTTAAYVAKTGLTVHTDIRAQLDFKISTLTLGSTAGPQILSLRGATNVLAAIHTSTTNASAQNSIRLVWYNGAGSPTNVTVAHAFVADTTYTITLRHKSSTDTSTADGNYYVDINGENVIAVTDVTTPQNPSVVQVGMMYTYGAITGALTYDNFTLGYK